MKKSLLSALILSLLWLMIPSAHALMIKTDPEIINPIDTGNTFNANIKVEGAVDLAGFQLELVYDPAILSIINVVLGNFLPTPGRTVVTIPGMPEYDIDNEAGMLTCNRVTEGTGAGASGSGTLATITFQVISLSDDLLKIINASLTDTKGTESSIANGKLSTANGNVHPRYHIFSSGTGPGGSISPSGDVLVEPGANQTFTIQPAACYHITNVITDSFSRGAISQYLFPNVNENHTIQAAFEINKFIITASAGTGGKISPSGSITAMCGERVEFNLTPDDCYHIADLIVDGVSQGAISPYILTVSKNHIIQAVFAKDPVIQASAGAGGKTEPTGDVCVKPEEDKKFAITPDKGFRILDLKVDNESKGKISEYLFEKVSSNHTIHADFCPAVSGDIDGSGAADLGDAISVLRILADIKLENQTIFVCTDLNGDGRIGIEEVLYILQKVAGLREFDAIMGLRILAGIEAGDPEILKAADINGDGQIGIEEVIYFIQKMSGIRE
ncbi:MAG: hypothetical protein BWK80_15590 [Desulfobacteraceae bacterium IS3]|nr:MAG: hypothetical protein BWK80_15590 [Desulfobacteraceae bacterium IS3]